MSYITDIFENAGESDQMQLITSEIDISNSLDTKKTNEQRDQDTKKPDKIMLKSSHGIECEPFNGVHIKLHLKPQKRASKIFLMIR